MGKYNFTMTNDSLVVITGNGPVTVKKGSANFNLLRQALLEGLDDKVPKLLTVTSSVENWLEGEFTFKGETLYYKTEKVDSTFAQRAREAAAAGISAKPLLRFWARLQENPSFRSVQQLWSFMSHAGIPITEDGCFLAYKGVRNNFMDEHTGTVCNKPGTSHRMARNKISDDPQVPCHYGYHVGSTSYATSFGSKTVICKVSPTDVVCVPYDHSQQKMRVCSYGVIGHYTGQLPSTMYGMVQEEKVGKPTAVKPKAKTKSPVVQPATVQPAAASPLEKTPSNMNLGELRKYATHSLQIPGASKIPGGKQALLAKVLEAEIRKTSPRKEMFTMTTLELLACPLDQLRKFAGRDLKMVGASKIPGGKTALVSAIGKHRDN